MCAGGVCVPACASVRVHMHASTQRPEEDVRCLLSLWWTQSPPPVSTPRVCDYRHTQFCLMFCVVAGDLNSGPRVCTASAITHWAISPALSVSLVPAKLAEMGVWCGKTEQTERRRRRVPSWAAPETRGTCHRLCMPVSVWFAHFLSWSGEASGCSFECP